MSSPLRLEWDEDGLHLMIDVAEIQDFRLGYDGVSITGKLHTGQALALYDVVEEALGEWAREGRRVEQLHSVHASLHPSDEDCGYALDDPKHPTYRERMADAGDLARKREREER